MAELMVVLDEEYGYKRHFWFPKMTAAELEMWWQAIDDITIYFHDPSRTLPGKVEMAQDMPEEDYWMQAWGDDEHYKAHLHWHDDSFLKRPDKTVIHHMGWVKPIG